MKKLKIGSGVKIFGKVDKVEVLNLQKVQTSLAAVQKRISAAPMTMKPVLDCSAGEDQCAIYFSGSAPDLNVGVIASNIDLEKVRTLIVDAPADSTAIVRFEGKKFNLEKFTVKTSLASDHLVMDFPEKYSISFEYSDLTGIVLAPYASLEMKETSLSGVAISAGFQNSCSTSDACVQISSPEIISACLPN